MFVSVCKKIVSLLWLYGLVFIVTIEKLTDTILSCFNKGQNYRQFALTVNGRDKTKIYFQSSRFWFQ